MVYKLCVRLMDGFTRNMVVKKVERRNRNFLPLIIIRLHKDKVLFT